MLKKPSNLRKKKYGFRSCNACSCRYKFVLKPWRRRLENYCNPCREIVSMRRRKIAQFMRYRDTTTNEYVRETYLSLADATAHTLARMTGFYDNGTA